MKQKKIIFFFITLCLLKVSSFADTPSASYSYSILTKDGKYIFVMLAKNIKDDEKIQNQEKRKKALELRERYEVSGLYSIKDFKHPLWKVNWYSKRVWLSDNGNYLVTNKKSINFDEKKEIKKDANVLKFFFKGKNLHNYKLKNLVKDYEVLPRSVSSLIWHCKSRIDNNAEQFTVITFDKQKHIFDITNGKLILTQLLDDIPCDVRFGQE